MPPRRAKATPKWAVAYLRDKTATKPCSTVHRGDDLLPVLTYPLMMKRTAITGRDQELLQVRPSLMKMSIIIDENTKAHLVEA